MDINDVVNNAIIKAKENPIFFEDLIKYVKYTVIKDCSAEKVAEINNILDKNDLKLFLSFANENIPNFSQNIVDYINTYKND